jgi:phage-related protein
MAGLDHDRGATNLSPNPLTPAVSASKNAVQSSDPLVFLYDISIPSTPPSRLRLVAADEEVEWRGNTYLRAPMAITEIVEDSEGNLPSVKLSIPNLSREVGAIMKSYSGLAGQTAKVLLVSLEDLSSGQPVREIDFTVADGTLTVNTAQLRLQIFSPRKATVPGGKIARQGCWYKFKGKRCGFALTEADTGAITCDHTYDGANGCTAKGALYVAEGLVAIHPMRFGGFRSIPRPAQGGKL